MTAVDVRAPGTTTGARGGDGAGPLVGTARLVRFALRRDRVRIPGWALGVGGTVVYFGVAIQAVYPDEASRQTRAAIMADPAGALMTGPGYGLEDYTFGVMLAAEMLGFLGVAAALMSIFLVVRHTRSEEETGRAELVRSGVVGRYAPLSAALVDVLVANLAVAAVLFLALLGNGLETPDSAAFAAGVAMVGLVFGAVAAVTAQVGEHARTASGLAGAALGLAFVLRGVGDMQQRGGSALSWTSPIGWSQQMRTYVDLRWWPLLLGGVLAAVLVAAAYLLASRRDLGAGLVAAGRGRASAGPWLRGPVGLGARLQRGSVLGWSFGMLVMAALTGAMAEGIVDSFEAQPQLMEVFGAGLTGADVVRGTLSAFLGFFAMAVAVFAVVSVHQLRRDEAEGRTGAVLATAVGRGRWLLASVAVTTGGAVVVLVVTGLALGGAAAATTGDAGLVGELALAGLVHLPVVLCFAGLAALLHGLGAPAWPVWLVLVASIVVGLYGPLLDLPAAVVEHAPFALVPAVPAESFEAGPVLGALAVAVLLTGAAVAALRRRDLVA
ncbi:polyketide antibiotic transporter [Cellulomonas sp. APG4]|uniref:ABC transporter permease n=1 Tax=Cellulomonas sp. APG4 TaxID=1538656 RepID=UPI00137A5396|nr:polyketide antibiotic transporter [Cellulomonas sp. APG4]NCT91677.1 polyketide antibiotic transporter [Cellulomonas sp. APG4]